MPTPRLSRSPRHLSALCACLASFTIAAGALAQAEKQPTPNQQPAPQPAAQPDAQPADLPTVDAVVEKFLSAVGGKQAADGVKQFTMKGTLTIPGAGMSGDLTIWMASDPERMIMKITLPGMGDIQTGIVGDVGWQSNPMMGTTLIDDKDLESMRNESKGVGSDPRTAFDEVAVVGIEPFEGTACVLLRCSKGENVSTQFYDRESGLLIGSRDKVSSQMGTIEATTVIGDYKEFGAVKVATKFTSKTMGQSQVMEFKDVSFDPIDDSIFALPPEVETLVKQKKDKGDAAAPAASTANETP